MPAPLLIVGQGVAGTLLAWEFERAGFDFEIADAGHDEAASRVAAGIVNPITGRRFVKNWRVETLLPAARAAYRELEGALGIPLLREMRVWRMFDAPGDRALASMKLVRGEWGPFVDPASLNDDGFWIESAVHVDLPVLLSAARRRWLAQGRLQVRRVNVMEERDRRDVVVRCVGVAAMAEPIGTPYERARGELLRLAVKAGTLESSVIRNLGAWMLPLDTERALVGATYDRAASDLSPSEKSRVELERHAKRLLEGHAFTAQGRQIGWRVTVPDRRPAVGRLPGDDRVGVINGLGSKGTLYAPWLARQWVNHLSEGVPFDPEVDVKRFAAG